MQTKAGGFSPEDGLKAIIVAAVIVLDAVWMLRAGYSFVWSTAVPAVLLAVALFALAEMYRHWRPNRAFVVMTRETGWLLMFSASAALLSNLAVTLNRPVVDPVLAAFGRTVGFNWLFWHEFVSSQPILNMVLSVLYVVALPQIVFVVIALALLGRLDRVQEFVLALMLAALIAILISAIFPSAGALAYYRPVETVQTIVDLNYKQAFFDLRAGKITTFSLPELKGLIAFPSYHAALSALVVMAFRGMRRFFWPLAIINLLIVASAPVEGGHFLVDLVSGVAVAMMSVAVVEKIRARLQRGPAAGAVEGVPVSFSETA